MKSSAAIEENSSSNGITTSSSTPSPSITSRLTSNGMISFGAAPGEARSSGCGSKVSTVSAPSITAGGRVDAVEDADRHVPRSALDVGELGHLDPHRKPAAKPFTPARLPLCEHHFGPKRSVPAPGDGHHTPPHG